MLLCFQFPLHKIVPDYFWHALRIIDKPFVSFWYLILAVILTGFVIWFVLNHQKRVFLNLFLLILCGWSLQMSFGLVEGKGIDGIRLRMVDTGHAEFAKIAIIETNLWKITTNYERILKLNSNIRFANTKPPGQLILYMLTQKLSNLIDPEQTLAGKFKRLTTFASYTYPFLAYLVLIPLYFVSREFLDKEIVFYPLILYLFVPCVTLITLHYDQVFYPLLFMTTLYLSVLTGKKGNIYFAAISGSAVYLSVFVSFSLLPLVLLCPLAILICLRDKTTDKIDIGLSLRLLGGYIGSIFLFYLIFQYLFSYDLIVRYKNVIAYHENWKSWQPGIGNILWYSTLNVIEFSCWVGIPAMVFYGAGIGGGVTRLFKPEFSNLDLLEGALFIVFICISVLGKTKGEVHRLWMFVVPLVCMIACSEIFTRFTKRIKLSFAVLIVCQLITTMLIKRNQDFW